MLHIHNVGGVWPLLFFLYVPTVLNVEATGNGTVIKNVLNGTVRFGLSLVSSLLSTALLL